MTSLRFPSTGRGPLSGIASLRERPHRDARSRISGPCGLPGRRTPAANGFAEVAGTPEKRLPPLVADATPFLQARACGR